MEKIGFGGGCHWCTEAVFQSLPNVEKVDQGWISSTGEHSSFSEAVIVHFFNTQINLADLIKIHLLTHSCTSDHPMRKKYRSAIYTFIDEQLDDIREIIDQVQLEFTKPIVTQILPFREFKENEEQYQDYYLKNKGNQFCQTYIDPKLNLIRNKTNL
jgi:peptide-methionine (S)-S-oxide reductase